MILYIYIANKLIVIIPPLPTPHAPSSLYTEESEGII